ncbi:hypothetical protein DH2020_020635 [Rehmannia glutinosa]|uniref:Bet v I/Major latex protein domain-containing protein n=1 Tax=Rehmannia glutinosa TaxID=99300 RepID=A0ABR0WGQ6_REHGL
MGLSGKLVSQISIKTHGNMFYELLRYNTTRTISQTSVLKRYIERVDLLSGQWGTVGSVICWHFNLGGQKKFAKEIVEAIDEKKKSITFKVIEGGLMEAYNTFKLTVNVDTNCEDNIVTWTLEYEKKNESVPDPQAVMNLFLGLTKEIEPAHIKPFFKEMGLSGKLVSQIRTKTSGTVFYELFRYKPHHISNICPEKIERVDLLEGQWGTVGSVNHWHFNLDGKKKSAKAIIEAIDEKKKSITFNLLEGDLMEAYNTFKFIVAIDTNGEDNLVTWTLEYEKKTQDVSEPHAVMNLGLSVTKEIERCHLLLPN